MIDASEVTIEKCKNGFIVKVKEGEDIDTYVFVNKTELIVFIDGFYI